MIVCYIPLLLLFLRVEREGVVTSDALLSVFPDEEFGITKLSVSCSSF